MDIKDILHNRRIEAGMTMKELSQKVGVSEGTISRWESGEIANMRRDKIQKLADALHITPGVIMGWPEDLSNELAYQKYAAPGEERDQRDLDRLLSPDEQEVLFAYRESIPAIKNAIRGALGLEKEESSLRGSSEAG